MAIVGLENKSLEFIKNDDYKIRKEVLESIKNNDEKPNLQDDQGIRASPTHFYNRDF